MNQIKEIPMLDRYLEPDEQEVKKIIDEDFAMSDFEENELPESFYTQASHRYECFVYNELEKLYTRRDYVS